jgi:amino acid adenylation domain-containing protein/non-ribosomal peptide synthase protein (TIGR01720 family)
MDEERFYFPASFGQKRLWFINQLDTAGAAYNIPSAVRLNGPLDLAAAERAINEIIRRHEALRTTFEAIDGHPVQVVCSAWSFALPLVDLSGLPASEREAETLRLAQEDARQPFDLTRGPLLRAKILRLGATEHVLLLNVHHIVFDEWSLGVFLRELALLYDAFTKDKPSPLPGLPIQYADYAVWQQDWLQPEALDEDVLYWKRHLKGDLPVLELPADRPRSAVQTFRGANISFTISDSLSRTLISLSQMQGCTLFMTLLAAFQTLLHRYSGQEDILVGSPIANRDRHEIEGLIGFFVNSLVLKTSFAGDPTFLELLGRVRSMTLEAYEHAALPFEKLVEVLKPERDRSRSPLFQASFHLQTISSEGWQLPGLTLSTLEIENATAKYDLSLTLLKQASGLGGWIEYNADLFEPATIDRLAGHFQTLLERIIANPEQKISKLPLLSEAEKRLISQWNGARRSYSKRATIQELFEAQVGRTPGAVAVTFGDELLSYHELNRRANQLAAHLRRLGVGPEVPVAVCLGRSIEMIVGLIGILKAGGAYVPLDPAYPAERLAFILEDARTPVLLTSKALLPLLPNCKPKLVCIDADSNEIADESEQNTCVATGPENIAYMIYTSGSTGEPKGVLVSHANVARLFDATGRFYKFSDSDVWTLFHSYAFDFSVWEIWGALLYGGRLVVVPYLVSRSPDACYELLAREQVTVLNQTPSAFRQLIEVDERRKAGTQLALRYVILGGEALELGSLKGWMDRHSDAQPAVVNMYGITETTVHVTYRAITEADVREKCASLIGAPIDDLQVYLLDKHLEPVPIAVAGEIYIGGDGLARGYFNRADLTAERFVPDPFGEKAGGRLYKSGDLARYSANGEIEYLGRIDHQVKIRGYRIELGEIEYILEDHDGVQACAVVARDDARAERRLVAYVVPSRGKAATTVELRRYVKDKLPDYMVPAAFTYLDELPLTPSGKLDRRALLSREQESLEIPRKDDFLSTPYFLGAPYEEVLAAIWEDLLRLDRVGIHDNFFDLGGHSLLAIQLCSRVRRAFQVELPVETVFESPTIVSLARKIEVAQGMGECAQAAPIKCISRDGDVPLSFAQQRLWFLDHLEPTSALYNIPVAVRLMGRLNLQAVEQAFRSIVNRHETLQTSFVTVDGRPKQVLDSRQPFTIPLVELSNLPSVDQEAQVTRVTEQEARRPFDLSRSPLVRVTVLRLSMEEHVLLLTMHHIISDGWSIGVLIKEMGELYEAVLRGRESSLADLPIQYADYAAWQQQWLQDEVLENQLSYWKNQLANTRPLLELPTDRPRPSVQSYRGATCPFELSDGLTESLKKLSRQEEVTLFMTLLAAFQLLLYRYSGEEDIVVGTPAAGRNREEAEGLIGFFVNTLVIRTDLSGEPNFTEILRRVRKVVLEAYMHQDVPFEKLVDELNVERALSHTPLFQVMFALENMRVGALELPGLRIEVNETHAGIAKFDLLFAIEESEGRLTGSIEYNIDLFDRPTIVRMARHYTALLEEVVKHGQKPINSLAILNGQERRQLVKEWNETGIQYRPTGCLHEMVEEQVEKTPGAVAVLHGAERITYAELDARANQLARYLRRQGVRPEVLVGICLDRSIEMIVAILGVLKAGGGYVPLDHSYPAQRIAYMVEDARVEIILTEQQLEEKLPHGLVKVVRPGRDINAIRGESRQTPARRACAENLAYVIYTSGSTGKPKGVAIEHRSAATFLQWVKEEFTPEEMRGVLASTSICFDLSVFELFGPLCMGGKVILVENALQLEATQTDEEITLINTVPSAMAELVRSGAIPSTVQTVNLAGEALHKKLVEKIYEQQTIRRVLNLYGPSEDTTYTTCARIERTEERVSIGKPITGTQVYILDKEMEPVPIGVVGEIYIGGEGLARGYLNRPELTAESFIPNHLANSHGARLYRTGDKARYLADGRIDYLGRTDHQVKIRGFRIELGEIETALCEHPALKQAVVLVSQDEAGKKRLVGYVVPDADQLPTDDELRGFLTEKVPAYMVPASYVKIETLPLTTSGKVDRQVLALSDSNESGVEKDYLAPRNVTEEVLARIWEKILGVERIGVHDNFFELGGDSILSIQVIARANQAGLSLIPKQMFQHPTIAGLAAVAGTAPVVKAQQEVVTGSVPLTPIQCWFFESDLPSPHHFNQSVMLEAREPLDPSRLERVLGRLLEHHDALRLRFVQGAAGYHQTNSGAGAEVPFTRVDLSLLTGEEQTAAIEQTVERLQSSLDLTTGPLLRAALFELESGRPSRLFLVIHHLAVDGVSWRILLEDLQRGYEQASRGEAIEFAPKTTSFQHWARRLVEHANQPAAQQDVAFWMEESRKRSTRLPVDYRAGDNTISSSRTVSVTLSQADTGLLLQKVPEAYNTQINDVLLTALVEAFREWTGEDRLLLDLEGHGREPIFPDLDLSRTVGWFTTISPVVLDLKGAFDPGAAVKTVKEQLRAVPNRGIGYGLLRYLANDPAIRAGLEQSSRSEVSFNYLGQFDQLLSNSSMFRIAHGSTGSNVSLDAARPHLLEVNGFVVNGILQTNWNYSENLHRRETIEGLAEQFMLALQSLLAHCVSAGAGGYTPSDFPLAKLSQRGLDRLVGEDRQIENIYPLSPMQEGILFHSLHDRSGLYIVQLSCIIYGEFNRLAFEGAWQKVLDRHPALRSAFAWENLDNPVQVVRRRVRLLLEHRDWRELSRAERQNQLEALLQDDRDRGFQLSEAPLLRLHLMEVAKDCYQFILTHHHLLLDGWSLYSVLHEVKALYEALCNGVEPDLEQARPYCDYIAWLQKQDISKAELYWRKMLEGFTAPTRIGEDRSYISFAVHEEAYDAIETSLQVEATQALQSFARQHRLTLNAVTQGAWAALLSRYSGEEDILFGTTVSGRPAELQGIESMVGLFINTLPVRVRVARDESALELLNRMQAQQVEAQQYDYSPLAQVQGWSEMGRGMALFESLLVFENYPVSGSVGERVAEGGASFKTRNARAIEMTHYPLTVVATPGQEMSLRMIFDCSRFAADTVSRMMQHFRALLEGIAREPNVSVYKLPMLTPPELDRLLIEWNDTFASYPKQSCVHQLFELQCEQAPGNIAIVFGEVRLSYRDLNERANQVAHYLIELGVGPETLVAVNMDRCPEMVIAVLGIVKTGAAYVPLDPEHPKDRLGFMLDDARASIVMTRQRFVEALSGHKARIVCMDTEWGLIDQQSRHNPRVETTGDNLAYVMYTSGSTGTPKGIAVPHRAITRLVINTDYVKLEPGDRLALASNTSFDAATFEIWGALLNGATAISISKQVALSPEEFITHIRQQQITTIFLTTALFNQIVSYNREAFRGVKQVLFGGEAVDAGRVKDVVESEGRPGRLLHVYGPTESTTFATWRQVEELNGANVPIGRAIANTQVYVLDKNLEPVPIGVRGELYIGGDGLARGYWGRADMTAEKFVPNRFSKEPGARMYKTGDLVRLLPNGDIEFIGRDDSQVKLRGFRIELREIEAVLNQHAAVRDAAVILREDDLGDRRLVAYAVANQQGLDAIELRNYLKERLPEYMVPAAFVMLDEMPLTPNSKVDRQSLPDPNAQAQESERFSEEAMTPVEGVLAGIFGRILGTPMARLEDNFFDLGGYSLLVTHLISEVRDAFGVELPIQHVFEAANLRELARNIEEAMKSEQVNHLPPITAQPREGRLPLSFAQQRLWFIDQLNSGSPFYNVPAAVRLSGHLNLQALELALNEVVGRHEALRTNFATNDGLPEQVILPSLTLSLPIIELLGLADSKQEVEVRRLMANEARRPFDLGRDSLLRVSLLKLSENEHILLLTMHHIVSDGWSMRLLIQEAASLYKAFCERKASPLPELSIQYADYAVWQQEWLQGEVLEAELSYWKKELAGVTTASEIPTDRPRPAEQTYVGATTSVLLPVTLTESLKALSACENVTLFMTLLAALKVLVYYYSGRQDVITGATIAGRRRTETETLIGCFINILVLRAAVSDNRSFRELLGQVRKVTLGAYTHQDLPFEKLVKVLQLDRDTGRTPLIQVVMDFQSVPTLQLDLPELALDFVDVKGAASHFDLHLGVQETERGLLMTWTYNTDLFEPATIARLLNGYEILLYSCVAQPDTRVSSLVALLAEADRKEGVIKEREFKTASLTRLRTARRKAIVRP